MSVGTFYFVDTAVFAYAVGDVHQQREPCRRVIKLATAADLVLHASVEMVQELLHHRLRRTDRAAAFRQPHAAGDLCVLHPFDRSLLARALNLVATAPVEGRDAVPLATAQSHGPRQLISPDPDFDVISDVAQVDPADVA